jgi:hypothetical protein
MKKPQEKEFNLNFKYNENFLVLVFVNNQSLF